MRHINRPVRGCALEASCDLPVCRDSSRNGKPWRGWFLTVLSVLVIAGCQRAGHYQARGTRGVGVPPVKPHPSEPDDKTKPPTFAPSPNLVWLDPVPAEMDVPVPIEFVTASGDAEEWNRLKEFWNESPVVSRKPTADQVAAMLGISPLAVAPLSSQISRVVKIKVPLGLENPLAYTPNGNRPTVGKWELGKKLFFDEESFLQPAESLVKESCAGCHNPARGFTLGKPPSRGIVSIDTPTLLNTVYNSYQFWNGRANALEEVVQRTIDDERDLLDPMPTDMHKWHGVVKRLRANPEYVMRFQRAFGTLPTQDSVGKAIATYVRTLLSGGSLQDRAERAARGRALQPSDYEKFLDGKTLRILEVESGTSKEQVSKEVHLGHTLFRGKAGCVNCHDGSNYTDNGFHNIGVGDSAGIQVAGRETGRFAHVPAGLKDRRLIGAYKTPTLRSLPQTGPYFHNGIVWQDDNALFEAVRFHIHGGTPNNPYIDPAIKKLDLNEVEVRALVQFLRALDGEPLPEIVTKAAPPAEKIPAPKEIPAAKKPAG